MIQSYSTIVSALRQFSEAHLNTQRFKCSFVEQLDNFSTEEKSFPILFAIPDSVGLEENIDSFNFRVYCLDILQKDRSNEPAIMNSTLLVLTDLANWLRLDDTNELNLLNNPIATPVNNALMDNTAGWFFDIEIEANAQRNSCSIPYSDAFQLTGITVDVQTIHRFLTCDTLELCSHYIDIVNNSVNTISLSAGTIYSGATNLYDIFSIDPPALPFREIAYGSITSGLTSDSNFKWDNLSIAMSIGNGGLYSENYTQLKSAEIQTGEFSGTSYYFNQETDVNGNGFGDPAGGIAMQIDTTSPGGLIIGTRLHDSPLYFGANDTIIASANTTGWNFETPILSAGTNLYDIFSNGGGGSATLRPTYVGYGNSSSALTGTQNFQYTTNETLLVQSTSFAAFYGYQSSSSPYAAGKFFKATNANGQMYPVLQLNRGDGTTITPEAGVGASLSFGLPDGLSVWTSSEDNVVIGGIYDIQATTAASSRNTAFVVQTQSGGTLANKLKVSYSGNTSYVPFKVQNNLTTQQVIFSLGDTLTYTDRYINNASAGLLDIAGLQISNYLQQNHRITTTLGYLEIVAAGLLNFYQTPKTIFDGTVYVGQYGAPASNYYFEVSGSSKFQGISATTLSLGDLSTPGLYGQSTIQLNNGLYTAIAYARTQDSNFGNPLGNGALDIATNSTAGIVFGTTSNKPVVIGTNNLPRLWIQNDGLVRTATLSATTLSASTIQSDSLAGSGDRMVVANAAGVLSTQAIPTGSGGTSSLNPTLVGYGSGTSGLTGNSAFYYVTNSAGGYTTTGLYLYAGTRSAGSPFYQEVVSQYSLLVGGRNGANNTYYYYDTQTNFHTALGGHRFDSTLYSDNLSGTSITASTIVFNANPASEILFKGNQTANISHEYAGQVITYGTNGGGHSFTTNNYSSYLFNLIGTTATLNGDLLAYSISATTASATTSYMKDVYVVDSFAGASNAHFYQTSSEGYLVNNNTYNIQSPTLLLYGSNFAKLYAVNEVILDAPIVRANNFSATTASATTIYSTSVNSTSSGGQSPFIFNNGGGGVMGYFASGGINYFTLNNSNVASTTTGIITNNDYTALIDPDRSSLNVAGSFILDAYSTAIYANRQLFAQSGVTATFVSGTTISGGTIYSGSTNLYDIFSTKDQIAIPTYQVAYGNGTSLTSSSGFKFSANTLFIGSPSWDTQYFGINAAEGIATEGSSYVYRTGDPTAFFYTTVRGATEINNYNSISGCVEFSTYNTSGIIFGNLNSSPIMFGTAGAERMRITDTEVSTAVFSATSVTTARFSATTISASTIYTQNTGYIDLAGGSVTVNTTKVTANSNIFLSYNSNSLTNIGVLAEDKSARVAGTSFKIVSSNPADTSTVAWFIIEPSA